MRNPLRVMGWLLSRDPYENGKYFAWQYETFGPGKHRYRPMPTENAIDQIAEEERITSNPHLGDDPVYIAGLGTVLTEMQGHAHVSMFVPRYRSGQADDEWRKSDEHRERFRIACEERRAIDRFAGYYNSDGDRLERLLDQWKKIKNPAK